jgi:hypothetical protein
MVLLSATILVDRLNLQWSNSFSKTGFGWIRKEERKKERKKEWKKERKKERKKDRKT